MPKIFISYRREDSESITGRIDDRLAPHFGRDQVFLDVDTIPFGVDFRKHLDQAVGQCDVLLAVIGEQWLGIRFRDGPKEGQRRLDDPADFVRIEIQAAALSRDIPVIPVLVGKAAMPREEDLPDGLKPLVYRHAAEVRLGRDFHVHVDRLIAGIAHLLGAGSAATDVRQQWEKERPREPRPGEVVAVFLGSGVEMKFAWIPPGTFLMGSPKSEPEHSDDDELQHRVTLTRGFRLGIHPVTQAQWQAIMGNNPSDFKGNDRPVENVSWDECQEFCRKLGEKTGKRFRLPTEAEWEYACRAGTTTPFSFGDTISPDQANYDGNYTYGKGKKGTDRQQTTPVGSFPANAWGLTDMHGNVWEWCEDLYAPYETSDVKDPKNTSNGTARVLRGGSWYNFPDGCRSAYRVRGDAPGLRYDSWGCRVCLCLD